MKQGVLAEIKLIFAVNENDKIPTTDEFCEHIAKVICSMTNRRYLEAIEVEVTNSKTKERSICRCPYGIYLSHYDSNFGDILEKVLNNEN